MPPIEQSKLKRAGLGLRTCDRDQASPGYTLFAPTTGGGKVYLIDLEGDVVHIWQMPQVMHQKAYDLVNRVRANPRNQTLHASFERSPIIRRIYDFNEGLQ